MPANRTDNRQRHGRDLRLGRVSLTGQVYALTSVTHDRVRLFTDISLGRIVVKAMGFHHEKGNVASLAFVVMPDHFHWLIALSDRMNLAGLMHSVKGHTGREIKRTLVGDSGPIWQAGYFDHALRREEDVKALARYMIMNPLRAGLVEDIWSYPLWDAIWVEDADFLL